MVPVLCLRCEKLLLSNVVAFLKFYNKNRKWLEIVRVKSLMICLISWRRQPFDQQIFEIVWVNVSKCLKLCHFDANENQSKTLFVWWNQGTMQQDKQKSFSSKKNMIYAKSEQFSISKHPALFIWVRIFMVSGEHYSKHGPLLSRLKNNL